ncbi:hypothetical protein [Candidatus Profftia tarda]|uniref:hypothetical protein n=1 Tax=Candidatus Profftia tarda TaxID=1177216 RepID=UPI001C1FDDF9|nr:hypothetical protein [Candidatus Profftia tarda]
MQASEAGFSLSSDSTALQLIENISNASYKHTLSRYRQKLTTIRYSASLKNIEGIRLKIRQKIL